MDVLDMTRRLLAFDTTNPPGNEQDCARWVACELERLGLQVELQIFGSGSANVVAHLPATDTHRQPLLLTGHLDTVPLGAAPWKDGPFAGEVHDGKIFGRGASDMKGGVAAMMAATARIMEQPRRLRRAVTLAFTSGEETGCAGAAHLVSAERKLLGSVSAMLVGEPTGNRISTGHKGCIALRARTRGIAAHSSMPEKGRNAIYGAAEAIQRIAQYQLPKKEDALLGRATINVGMIVAGLNYNSVPDAATFTVDVRTVPALSHDAIQLELQELLGDQVELERFVDMSAVSTSRDDPFVECAFDAVHSILGSDAWDQPLGTPFFSDASVFAPHLRCPTIILGPGDPEMAHQTDEYCRVDRLLSAVDIYEAIISTWCA